jgi:predicted Rossmann fold flavoprotein
MIKKMNDVIVVGAGAAGMLAAGVAAKSGINVTIIEKNEKPGRKLMITGKGRCNVTNACETREFMSNVPRNGRFLYSSLSQFSTQDTMNFFESLGVKLKIERGNRVFPESDRAVDIVDALHSFIKKNRCKTMRGRVYEIVVNENKVTGVKLEDGRIINAQKAIICTGGKSYPLTGSTGDGYRLAEQAGHTVTPLSPSLVPLETEEGWVKELQGLSLRNVKIEVKDTTTDKQIYNELGEMLFTHFGVSGPLILSASSHMRKMQKGRYIISIDLKPGLTNEQLEIRLQRDFLKYNNKNFINSLNELLPTKIIPVFVKYCGIDENLKINQLTKEMRKQVVWRLKHFEITISGFRPIEEAIITSGGVDVSEINPKTMESKLVHGLFFAGEILDCDAYTGGFNLQIAFSTGFVAGNAVGV